MEPRLSLGKALGTEMDYLRSVSLEGLRPLVAAAIGYFLVAMFSLFWLAPPRYLPFLVAQKSLYILLGVVFFRHLRAGKFPLKRFDLYSTLVVLVCLSSGLFTALSGASGPFAVYCCVLILGVAMNEISGPRASGSWALIWACWALVYHSLPTHALLLEFSKLMGIQLLALPALALRIRISRRQYRLIQKLEEALHDSEQTRQGLDQAVEARTQQLQMAYEELSLSTQERERMTLLQEELQLQLLQSQKMESLGRLAGGVAHDFNNLLTVILGNLELLKLTDRKGAEFEELVEDARTAGKRAAEVTGHLLAFSRKQVMKVKPLRIQSEIQDSLKIVERLIGEDIQLSVRLNCSQGVVEADPSRLQQVLMNLVVNARDAMPNGGKLEIGLREVGGEIELTVKDTGCGIDPSVQPRIFEPFFTTKGVGEGTGLGLSTVHGIVKMHSGRLTVQSKPGQGSTFSIYLPSFGSPASDSQGSSLVTAGGNSGRVLLVEDDDQVRNLTTRLLQIFAYTVKGLESGEKALRWLETEPNYDLLITDAVMPGMDGGKLGQAVQTKLPHLPVLFISGYTDDRLCRFGIHRGECNFLAKPFSPAQLQTAVAEILKGAPPLPQAARH